MKPDNLFFKFDHLFYVATLLYIVFVFINFTHNSFNGYERIDSQLSDGNQVFIKKDNLKTEISETLASNKTYSDILNRDCTITGDMHDRHKVRWVKALVLKNIFQVSFGLNKVSPYYTNILLHSFILFLSLMLIVKTFTINKKYIPIFLLYITFVFQHSLGEYSYSIFEMFFLSLSLYSSKNKKHLLFLTSCVMAVLNRESGFIILLTWLMFNNNDYKKFLTFSILTVIVFLISNYEILECLINPKFFISLESQSGQVNFTDLKDINLFSSTKLLLINFLFPFGLGMYFYFKSEVKNNILLYLFLIYFLTFIFATPAHHVASRLILLPLIFSSIYFYSLKKSSN